MGCLLGLLLATPAARAGAVLDTAGRAGALAEAQHEVDVHIEGVVARVTVRQIIVNPGKRPEQAVYRYDLPGDATVGDVSIRLADGRRSTTALVDATAALTPAPDPGGIGASPDLGMLRMIARDVPPIHGPASQIRATYELRVYPIGPGEAVTVTTRWVAPLRYDDGRLSLRIPGRGDAANLMREQVRVSMRPPPGVAGFGAVHGGGTTLAPGHAAGARAGRPTSRVDAGFRAPPHGDLVIDAALDFGPGAARPVVSFATSPIRDGIGALGLAVLTPPPSGPPAIAPERLLLVIDVSRSLGAAGLEAAATLADALLAAAPAGTRVEAILFDHAARPLFGGFRANDRDARKALADALRPGDMDNGSDLGAALDAARAVLRQQPAQVRPAQGFERGVRAPTLVAILSDGMLPLDLTARRALDRVGHDVLPEIEIFAATLVPDEAPVPDTRDGVLPALAGKTQGRAVAVRFGESAARARTLAAELARPAPLTDVSVEVGDAILERMDVPRTIAPGQGVIAVGLYRGPAPRALALTGQQGGVALRLPARRDAALGREGLALALAGVRPDDLLADPLPAGRSPADEGRVPSAESLDQARRLLVATARRAPAVTPYSTLVALDAGDRFARDRLALARAWGAAVFFRLPPPPEREPGYALPAFAWRALPETDTGTRRHRPTGQLDRGIIARLLKRHLAPRARACYEDALRRDPALAGSLTVVLEMARGEVQHAEVVRSTFPATGMEACVARAAYAIQVPRVTLGDDTEIVGVARYPLTFRKSRKGGEVRVAEPEQATPSLRDLADGDVLLEAED